MRRFSKVVAIALLLAIVVSVFGVLPSFAAETEAAETTYGTEIFNSNNEVIQDSGTTFKFSGGSDHTLVTAKDDKGVKMYKATMSNFGATRFYWQVKPETTAVFQNLDGTYEKNTEYMVVDFDISTDSAYIDRLGFETRMYNAEGEDPSAGSFYFNLRGASNDSLAIGLQGKGLGYVYGSTPYTNDVWQHVTFVYDFSTITAVKVHFYINGVYSGTCGDYEGTSEKWAHDLPIDASTYYGLSYFRIYGDDVQGLKDTSTTLANFTIKTFDENYDGPFTGDRALACQGATLSDMADLAYCLENTPGEFKEFSADECFPDTLDLTTIPEVGEQTKYADVYDANGALRFTAYKWSDLDANLQDGDVVTLYKCVLRPLLVPTGATITFKDAAAEPHTITPGTYNEGDLVNIAAANVNVDFATIKVVERARSTYAYSDGGTDLSDVWAGSGSYVYTLLGDVTDTVLREGVGSYYQIFDLNGYTATLSSSGQGFASGARLRICDGNLVWNAGSNITLTNGSHCLAFEDVNITHNYSTFVDGRGGSVIFKDCTITRNPYLYNSTKKQYTTGSLVSIKSDAYYYKSAMSVIVDNTDIDFTNVTIPEGYTMYDYGNMFLMNAYAASKAARYTGSRNFLTIRNGSDIKMVGAGLIDAPSYMGTDGELVYERTLDEGSTTTGTQTLTEIKLTDGAKANKNESYISISDSTIENNYQIVQTSATVSGSRYVAKTTADGVTWAQSNTLKVYATAYDYDVDVNISSSSISVGDASVVYVARPSNADIQDMGENFCYDVDLTIDGDTKISTDTSLIYRQSNRTVDMQVNLADGVKLTTQNVVRTTDGGTAVVKNFGTNGVIAHSALDTDYDYVVSSDFTHYTYAAGDASGEFDWNNAVDDNVDMTRFATLDEGVAGTYHYEWAVAENAYSPKIVPEFKPGANLTLNRDIALNLLIPATVDLNSVVVTVTDANDEAVAVKTFATPVEKDGVNYYKMQISGITPNKAEDTYKVTVQVNGAYDDNLSKTFVVSPVQYAQDMLALDTTAEDAELVALLNALLNYFEAAYAYGGVEKNFTDVAVGEAVYGTLPENGENTVIEAYQLNLKSSFTWIITLKEGVTNASVAYTLNGTPTNAEVVDGKAYITLKACDVLNAVTVTADQGTYTLNFATYVEDLGEVDAKVSNLLAAMSVYADAARAYQN